MSSPALRAHPASPTFSPARAIGLSLAAAVLILAPELSQAAPATQPEPLWAYGYTTPPAPGDKAIPQAPPTHELRKNEDVTEQTKPRSIPDSKVTYSLLQIRDGHTAVDWFPEEHAPMPPVVLHGPASMGELGKACALCHLANGKGRPENAPVGGQPVTYFIKQLEDFKNDARASADPRKPNVPTMIALAKAMSADEMKAAADYFGAIKWTPWTRVVETDLVPKTRIVGNLFLPTSKEKTEPIGARIIEVPEDEVQSDTMRNPHSGFIAYVPVGSLKKGKDLVTTGGTGPAAGRTVACATCHGPDLMGLGEVPAIAGRAASYLVRQMYDLQQGTRKGPAAVLMQPTVAKLTNDDFIAIAAYVTSLGSVAAH